MKEELGYTQSVELMSSIGQVIDKDLKIGTFRVPGAAQTGPISKEPQCLSELAVIIFEHLHALGVSLVANPDDLQAETLLGLYFARKEAQLETPL